jgi:hypothetical protein
VLAVKNEPQTPVALAEDVGLLANSPNLLVLALRRARKETHHACSPADLKTHVVPPVQNAFLEAVSQRAESGRLPPTVGRLLQKKKPLLFLLSDIVSGASAGAEPARVSQAQPHATRKESGHAVNDRAEPSHTLPTTVGGPPTDFVDAFDEMFRRLDQQGRSHNIVNLLDLRRALPCDRQAFDAGLRDLRRAGRYTLSAAESREGITAAEQEAGIVEDGALLLYVSRKRS